jgi:hypothetical protein
MGKKSPQIKPVMLSDLTFTDKQREEAQAPGMTLALVFLDLNIKLQSRRFFQIADVSTITSTATTMSVMMTFITSFLSQGAVHAWAAILFARKRASFNTVSCWKITIGTCTSPALTLFRPKRL